MLLLLLFALLVWEASMIFRVWRLGSVNPRTTAFMEQRRDELRKAGKSDDLSYEFVPYERISSNLRSAVLVSEDSRFFEHSGIDTAELEKVVKEAWEKRELGRGGSTITQQLAKNLYLSPSRSPIRKVRELMITKYLEWLLSKKRILELYLNVVEMGERVYGAEAAARHYFGVSAASLSPAQAALLAGSLPNPRKMNPGDPGPYLRSRRDIIVSRMNRWGYEMDRRLTDSEKSGDEEEPVRRDPEPDGVPVEEPEDSPVPIDEPEPDELPAEEPEDVPPDDGPEPPENGPDPVRDDGLGQEAGPDDRPSSARSSRISSRSSAMAAIDAASPSSSSRPTKYEARTAVT